MEWGGATVSSCQYRINRLTHFAAFNAVEAALAGFLTEEAAAEGCNTEGLIKNISDEGYDHQHAQKDGRNQSLPGSETTAALLLFGGLLLIHHLWLYAENFVSYFRSLLCFGVTVLVVVLGDMAAAGNPVEGSKAVGVADSDPAGGSHRPGIWNRQSQSVWS